MRVLATALAQRQYPKRLHGEIGIAPTHPADNVDAGIPAAALNLHWQFLPPEVSKAARTDYPIRARSGPNASPGDSKPCASQ